MNSRCACVSVYVCEEGERETARKYRKNEHFSLLSDTGENFVADYIEFLLLLQ